LKENSDLDIKYINEVVSENKFKKNKIKRKAADLEKIFINLTLHLTEG